MFIHIFDDTNIAWYAGNICFSWLGPTPKVIIGDTVSVRDILSNKLGHIQKFNSKRPGKLLAFGLANHDGEKWAKHRRILNPAFHLDNLKVPRLLHSCLNKSCTSCGKIIRSIQRHLYTCVLNFISGHAARLLYELH